MAEWDGITDAQAASILQAMRKLDLCGVLILAPVCPKCGMPHDYQVFHNLPPNDVESLLARILENWNPTKH